MDARRVSAFGCEFPFAGDSAWETGKGERRMKLVASGIDNIVTYFKKEGELKIEHASKKSDARYKKGMGYLKDTITIGLLDEIEELNGRTGSKSAAKQKGHLAHELVGGFLHFRFKGSNEYIYAAGDKGYDAQFGDGTEGSLKVSGSHNLGLAVELMVIASISPGELTTEFVNFRAGKRHVPFGYGKKLAGTEEIGMLADAGKVATGTGPKKKKMIPYQNLIEEIAQFILDANAGKKNRVRYIFKKITFEEGVFDKQKKLEISGRMTGGPRGIATGTFTIRYYD